MPPRTPPPPSTPCPGGQRGGDDPSGEQAGSFLCDYSDWRSVCTQYRLSPAPAWPRPTRLSLTITKAPVVYISGKPSDSRTGFVKTSLVSGSYLV